MRKITEVYKARQGLFLPKVHYVIDNREGSDINDSILKTWVAPAGRPIPMRSTLSAQQGLVMDVSFYFSNWLTCIFFRLR